MILVFFGIFYLFTAAYFFMTWLNLVALDSNLYLQDDELIVKDIAIAALLWPVVAPLADVHLFK